MDTPKSTIIGIRYGNRVLKNGCGAADETTRTPANDAVARDLPQKEMRNSSFNSEWVDFVDDFPHSEMYLRTEFVERVFPGFKAAVAIKECASEGTSCESNSDVSSDDGMHSLLSPRPRRGDTSANDDSFVCPIFDKSRTEKSSTPTQ